MSDRTRLVSMAALVGVAFTLAWLYMAFSSGVACSAQNVARGSTVGQLCQATPMRVVWVLGVLLTPALVATGAIAGVERRSERVLAVWAGLGFVILLLVTLPFLVQADRCSPEQKATTADCRRN